MLVRCCVLLCLILSAACSRVRPPRDQVTPLLPAYRLYSDDGPAFTDSARIVVKDAGRWRAMWTQATSTQSSDVPLPDVDFGREMVLIVAAGRMTPGDQIHVDSAGTRSGSFVVVVRTLECRRFSADVYPLEIVRVKRSDRPVLWVERRERAGDC